MINDTLKFLLGESTNDEEISILLCKSYKDLDSKFHKSALSCVNALDSEMTKYLNNPFTLSKTLKDAVEDRRLIVAICNDKVIGILTYKEFDYKESDLASKNRSIYFISNFYCDPKYRGKQVGLKLMNTIKDLAKSNNIEYLSLGVFAKNEIANKFYDKFGFTDFAIEKQLKI